MKRRESLRVEVTAYALRHAQREMSRALGALLDSRHPFTEGRSARVAALSLGIAERHGAREGELEALQASALLLDIGTIGVPADILRKAGELSDREWAFIRLHAELGYRLVRDMGFVRKAAKAILHHHERFDGQGYPAGLKGDAIPLAARIIAIADAYHSMTSERPYRKALSHEHARQEIIRNTGTQFDPRLVRVWLDIDNALQNMTPGAALGAEHIRTDLSTTAGAI